LNELTLFNKELKEFELCVTGEISASKIVPPNNIIFYGDNLNEILKLCGNGDIYVNGRLTTNDIEVVEGLRHFLTYNKYAI
jgi:hypothetical protein